jgi:hypothetical protein
VAEPAGMLLFKGWGRIASNEREESKIRDKVFDQINIDKENTEALRPYLLLIACSVFLMGL